MRSLAGSPISGVGRLAAIGFLSLAMVFGVVVRAAAHDHGVLKLVSKTFRAGDSLAIVGTKFTRSDEVTLVLIGVESRVSLGDIPTDSAGGFRRTVLVPASARAGQYRLVAEAIDGDEVASLQVVVQAASAPAPMEGMRGGAGHEGMQMDPTGAPLPLARTRNTAVTATAILLIIACGAGGATLLLAPRAHSSEDVS